MKMKFNLIIIILLGLIIISFSVEPKKKKKTTTEITITTTSDEEDSEEPEPDNENKGDKTIRDEKIVKKNGTESEGGKNEEQIKEEKRKEEERKKKEEEERKRKEEEEKKKKEEERKKKEEEEKKKKEEERKRKEEERKKKEEEERKKEEEEERKRKEEEERKKEEERRKEKEIREEKKKKEGKQDEDLIEEEGEGDEEQKSKEEDQSGKTIRDAENTTKEISPNKMLVLTAPYQDNEDFIISPLGLGTPVNFVPLQIDTTSYKTWVASASNKDNSAFSYDKGDSKTSEEPGEWDTVVDEEGTISGNIIYDKANLGKFEINHFKFIEAVEYEDGFNDFRNGKIGLGNCHYADDNQLEFCLLQRLKDNGSIERRVFSIREYSDTHGEIVIGDVTSTSKENDYPLLSVVDKSTYEDIDDDEFKMSWLTKISHVIFRNETNDKVKNIFKNNNIYTEDGLASFDSSCHYIEAPYSYINEFQEKMFDKFYPNACRKVNNGGTYMFLCNKERFEEIKDYNKDLTLIIVMDGNGFEIPMNFLFEQTRENDYEFFVHFKDYEQNIWNLGHPFFHHFTIIFDQDNQEIGVDGENIISLKDEVDSALNKKIGKYAWWKVVLFILFGLLVLCGICWVLRYYGIKYKLDNGVSPSLVDNESVDDLSFAPGQNVH